MLEVRNLETSYGRSQVLFGVDLDVRRSEVVSLLGRNGMGKTTTVRSIMGIARAKAGTIRFENQALNNLPSYRIAQAGLGRGAAGVSQPHGAREPGGHRPEGPVDPRAGF